MDKEKMEKLSKKIAIICLIVFIISIVLNKVTAGITTKVFEKEQKDRFFTEVVKESEGSNTETVNQTEQEEQETEEKDNKINFNYISRKVGNGFNIVMRVTSIVTFFGAILSGVFYIYVSKIYVPKEKDE